MPHTVEKYNKNLRNERQIFVFMQGDPLINLRSKEQEAELVRQTLAALTAMRIRFPGKTEEEAESVLDEVSALFLSRVCMH